MTRFSRCVTSLSLGGLLVAGTCGGSLTAATGTTTTTTPTQLTACVTWASTHKGAGIPPAASNVVAQRAAFLAAGGGLKTVGSMYYAMWFPGGWASTSPRRVLVTLHGTGGAPETDWSIDWKDKVSQKTWGYVSLKYVSTTGVHDDESTIYANLKAALTEIAANCDFGSPSMFLVGFSRGSAQSFPIAYLDRKDRRFFKAIGNNSGAWIIGEPLTPTMQAFVERKETSAYAGARFWMYCGARDTGHGYPMCDEMNNARTFVLSYGGTVEKLYQDPAGGHGGLAKNADAWGQMFSYFESLR